MSWRDLADILGSEARKISIAPKLDISNVLDASGSELLGLQARTKKRVDEAVAAFSRDGNWPELNEEESGMLAKRLLFAENIVRGFVMQRMKDGRRVFPSEPDCPRAEVLEFLLVDAWQGYGLLTGMGN